MEQLTRWGDGHGWNWWAMNRADGDVASVTSSIEDGCPLSMLLDWLTVFPSGGWISGVAPDCALSVWVSALVVASLNTFIWFRFIHVMSMLMHGLRSPVLASLATLRLGLASSVVSASTSSKRFVTTIGCAMDVARQGQLGRSEGGILIFVLAGVGCDQLLNLVGCWQSAAWL